MTNIFQYVDTRITGNSNTLKRAMTLPSQIVALFESAELLRCRANSHGILKLSILNIFKCCGSKMLMYLIAQILSCFKKSLLKFKEIYIKKI